MTNNLDTKDEQVFVKFVNKLDGKIIWGATTKDELKTAKVLKGNLLEEFTITDEEATIEKLLAPLPIFPPPAVLCLGLNYKKHAEERGNPIPEKPVMFMKNPSAINNPNNPIIIPSCCEDPEEVDYECELAIIIGKKAKNVKPEEALEYVLGFTCANDVSARRWQTDRKMLQWCFSKSFDTFCPLGPSLALEKNIGNPNLAGLEISTVLNGKLMQKSSCSDMIFSVPEIISFLSKDTVLLPGTVILTGTPEGVGDSRVPPVHLRSGDHVTISIERIGSLHNHVISATESVE